MSLEQRRFGLIGLEALYRVQELDTRIFDLREREEGHPLKAELEELGSREQELNSELESLRGELEGWRKKLQSSEAEVQRVEEKIKREEDKLYGGKVNNPKELRGLQAEVRSLKRQKDDLETELLEGMEAQDELSGKVEGLRAELDALRVEMEGKRKVLENDLWEIREEIDGLERQKEELEADMEEDILRLYRRLLESKHNLAVVKVEDGVCLGCRVELPGKEYDRFLKSETVFRCPNCGRILVK